MSTQALAIGSEVVVNDAGAERYPRLAGRTGVVTRHIWYPDGTLEYVVDFGAEGDWDWLCSHQVTATGIVREV